MPELFKKEHATYALSYYLDKAIPKGSNVCVLFPKSTFPLITQIIEQKKCTLTSPEKADIILTEPTMLTQGGGLFPPHEAKTLQNLNVIGIGSIRTWTKRNPAEYDYAPLKKVITEIGIHTPEHLELNVSSYQP